VIRGQINYLLVVVTFCLGRNFASVGAAVLESPSGVAARSFEETNPIPSTSAIFAEKRRRGKEEDGDERRFHVDDGSRWDWVRPPPATQSLRREEEEVLYRQTGYEEVEGGPPARPLRIRFIPLERHYVASRIVSQVTYRLPENHRQSNILAVEVTQDYAPGERRGENNGLYAVEYPETELPFQFPSRQMEEECYQDYLAANPVGRGDVPFASSDDVGSPDNG
jgi:hypothetical protein